MLRKFLYLPLALLAFGLIFGGIYAIGEGNAARDDIRAGLAREQMTIGKDGPKALVGKPVTSAETAQAQADVIWKHTMTATEGKTYATVDSYLAADGKGTTKDKAAAKLDAAGKPVPNPARVTAKDGAALRTGLMLSVLAFGVTDLVVGLGWGFLALGLFVLLFGVPAAYLLPRR